MTAVAKEPHWTSQMVAGTSITTNKNIEYNTRYFPLSDRDTILFASKQSDTLRAHLQPLKAYLLKENLSNEDITVALDVSRTKVPEWQIRKDTFLHQPFNNLTIGSIGINVL